jgi:transcription elongation factor Elf1
VKGAQLLMEKGQPKELIGTHACPGCNSTITVTGHGKGKEMVLKHSCGACGDDSAFCCATKPGSGATKGMEKEKK